MGNSRRERSTKVEKIRLWRLRLALHLGHPPAQSDKQKTIVAEEFRWLAFEIVTDELQDPADNEQRHRHRPEAMNKDSGHEQRQRERDHRDAQRMADPVHRMLMAGGVLRDPLLVGAITQHGADYLTFGTHNESNSRGPDFRHRMRRNPCSTCEEEWLTSDKRLKKKPCTRVQPT